MANKDNAHQAKHDEKSSANQNGRACRGDDKRLEVSGLLRMRFGLPTAVEVDPRPVRLAQITVEPLTASDRKLAVELLSAILLGQASLDPGQEAA